MSREATLRARALLLGRRLDLRNWPQAETLARAPLTIKLADGATAVLFRYGVVVLFGADAAAELKRATAEFLPVLEKSEKA
jgi:uncharacterized Rmd1/YagE family protein